MLDLKELKREDYIKLQQKLREMNEVDIAEFMNDLDEASQVVVLKLLSKDVLSDVFPYLNSDFKQVVIEGLRNDEVMTILEELDSDDLVDVLQELPANLSDKLIEGLSKETRAKVNQLLKYEEDSVGSLMTVDYIHLNENLLVVNALNKIKNSDISDEQLTYIYVTDSTRKLLGFIPISELIKREAGDELKEIMNSNIIKVNTKDDKEEAALIFKKYHLLQIPVVDLEGRIVGILTSDDFFKVIEEEIEEDYSLISGVSPTDKPYLETGVFALARKRIVWLLFLMLSATLTGFIINRYESVLATSVVLASFIPMLMDSGGNSGSQSSTLIIRSLALGEVKPSDVVKVIFKEFRVGLVCGVVLAVVNVFRVYLLDDSHDLMLAITVSLTLLITIVVAKIVGGILPIISKKLGQDPAVMASPLVTTIVDVITLMIYFEIASVILGI